MMGHLQPLVQGCSEAGFPPLCRGGSLTQEEDYTGSELKRLEEGRGGAGPSAQIGLSTCSELKRVKILQAKIPKPGMCRAPVLRKEKSTERKRTWGWGWGGGKDLLILSCREG